MTSDYRNYIMLRPLAHRKRTHLDLVAVAGEQLPVDLVHSPVLRHYRQHGRDEVARQNEPLHSAPVTVPSLLAAWLVLSQRLNLPSPFLKHLK